VIGIVVAVLGVLGLIYGPGVYREGKAFVGPIVELSKVEDQLTGLNHEFPFSAPAGGEVGDERLSRFLSIRRELQPKYKGWEELIHQVDEANVEDWKTAKEVLGATQDVMTTQISVLREHRMSPAEFVWIEDKVYGDWADAVASATRTSEVVDEVREVTADDLAFVDELEKRHGRSASTRELRSHFEARLTSLERPAMPVVDGISEADAMLFWSRRVEIAELDFTGYGDLHEAIEGAGEIDIKVGAD
jgi:hypothetical protein